MHLHERYPGVPGPWTWSWSIEYAPVELGGKRFWLPQTISSHSAIPPERGDQGYFFWTYTATYSNYHLLTVHSTILPATTTPVQ